MKIRYLFSALFIFFILLITSCCSETTSNDSAGGPSIIVDGPPNPETNYTVIADEHLSEEYKTAILLALNEWAEKTNNIFVYKLSFVNMTNQPADFSASHTIKIYVKDPGPGLAGWATWSVSNRSAYILVGGGVSGDYFRRVMLHELGHTLDLHFGSDTHYQGPNASIMWPGIGDGAAHLCCPELTAFCNNYTCKIQCTDVPKGEALHTAGAVWEEHSMP